MRTDIRGKPGWPLMGKTVRSRFSAGRRPPSLPRRSFYSEDGSPRPSAGWGRSSIGSGQGTPCSGPRGGWWSFTSGTKKSSELELRGKVGRLEGGASREGVKGPWSALLQRQRSSEGERNEILWEYELLQVSIHHEMKLYGNEYHMWYDDMKLKYLETAAHKMTHFRACLIWDDTARQCGANCICN